MVRRIFFFAGALGMVGCHSDFSSTLRTEEDRAVAVADEIVNGMAKRYADILYEGEVRLFAVDPDWLRDSRLFDSDSDVDYSLLEVGLRRVAEELPAERAAWLLRFDQLYREAEGVFSLYARVTDLYASHCCVLVAALLEKEEDGWRVVGIFEGGHAEETEEFRNERLTKGAKLLR